jgi:hypothetical protein
MQLPHPGQLDPPDKLDALLDAMQAQERLRTQDDIPSPEEQP